MKTCEYCGEEYETSVCPLCGPVHLGGNTFNDDGEYDPFEDDDF